MNRAARENGFAQSEGLHSEGGRNGGNAGEFREGPDVVRCRVCHLVQRAPASGGAARSASEKAHGTERAAGDHLLSRSGFSKGNRLCCRRCGAGLAGYSPPNLLLARCLGIAALVLYLPANLLPIVEVQYQGREIELTIVQGIRNLFTHGHFEVGILVTATSFLTPIMKILGLLFLSFSPAGAWRLRGRRRLYDLIGVLNPWNSMEVLLLATLLTLVDFGALATVSAGPGALAFTLVVLLTTGGAVAFQPLALWRGYGRGG